MGRRINADRKGNQPGENDRDKRDQNRQKHPVPNHLFYRHIMLKGIPQVALQKTRGPHQVLFPHRLVETVLLAKKLDFLAVYRFALCLQGRDVTF